MASKHVAEEGLDQGDKKRIKQAVITLGPYPGPDCGEQAVKDTSRLLGGFLDRIGELDLVIEKSHKTTLREITAAVSSTQFPTSAG
jgi:hypothetical protein